MSKNQEQLVIPADLDRILRYREVARILGLSRVSVWRMVRDGKIPRPVRVTPGVVGWRASDLKNFLDALTYTSRGLRGAMPAGDPTQIRWRARRAATNDSPVPATPEAATSDGGDAGAR